MMKTLPKFLLAALLALALPSRSLDTTKVASWTTSPSFPREAPTGVVSSRSREAVSPSATETEATAAS